MENITNLKEEAKKALYNQFFLDNSSIDYAEIDKSKIILEVVEELENQKIFASFPEQAKKEMRNIQDYLQYIFYDVFLKYRREKKASEEKKGIELTIELIKYLDKKWI